MITIYKYQFEINDRVVLQLPVDSEILSIQVQDGKPTLWAKVDTDFIKEKRILNIYGTGQSLDLYATRGKYITTIQLNGFVWHIFE